MESLNSPYSSHALTEASERYRKADKIVAVLARRVDLSTCDLLDIGTGSGHIASRLARSTRTVTSVNVTDERTLDDGFEFVRVAGYELPFANDSFDLVVSNHVIEHMPFQIEHLAEIARVLKRGGLLYLATPNRLALIEPHFGIPFLSWLPRPLAERCTRLLCRKEWDVYPLSARGVRKLAKDLFRIEDVTIDMLRDPEGHSLDLAPRLHGVLRRVPRSLYGRLYPLMPSYVWVLEKR